MPDQESNPQTQQSQSNQVNLNERPTFTYEVESNPGRLARKAKESPLMILGLSGCALALMYGAYKYKNRGHLSTSNFLMQLRVTAQGAVIGTLTLGVLYSLGQRIFKSDKSNGE